MVTLKEVIDRMVWMGGRGGSIAQRLKLAGAKVGLGDEKRKTRQALRALAVL